MLFRDIIAFDRAKNRMIIISNIFLEEVSLEKGVKIAKVKIEKLYQSLFPNEKDHLKNWKRAFRKRLLGTPLILKKLTTLYLIRQKKMFLKEGFLVKMSFTNRLKSSKIILERVIFFNVFCLIVLHLI